MYWSEAAFVGKVDESRFRLTLQSTMRSIGTAAPVAQGQIHDYDHGSKLTIKRGQLRFNFVLGSIFYAIGALALWVGIVALIEDRSLSAIPGPVWVFCPLGLIVGYLASNVSRIFAAPSDWKRLIAEITASVGGSLEATAEINDR